MDLFFLGDRPRSDFFVQRSGSYSCFFESVALVLVLFLLVGTEHPVQALEVRFLSGLVVEPRHTQNLL